MFLTLFYSMSFPLVRTQSSITWVLHLVCASSARPVLFFLHLLGNAYLNCNILFPQPHHFGQPPSLRVRKYCSRGDALQGKHLYNWGERIWSGGPLWVLLLRQQWAATLTASGLSSFSAIRCSFISELVLSCLKTIRCVSWLPLWFCPPFPGSLFPFSEDSSSHEDWTFPALRLATALPLHASRSHLPCSRNNKQGE